MILAELKPRYCTQKSFYGKAVIAVHNDNDLLELYSFSSLVASVEGGRVKLFQKWDFSQTTLRHVKEFLRQLGEPALTKAEMVARYV